MPETKAVKFSIRACAMDNFSQIMFVNTVTRKHSPYEKNPITEITHLESPGMMDTIFPESSAIRRTVYYPTELASNSRYYSTGKDSTKSHTSATLKHTNYNLLSYYFHIYFLIIQAVSPSLCRTKGRIFIFRSHRPHSV